MRLLSLSFLLAALLLAVRDLRHERRSHGGSAVSLRLVHRLAAAYDASRPGRRLAERLWRAQIHLSPSRWRAAQALLTLPLGTTLIAFGVDAVPAFASASTVLRIASVLLLWSRRHAAGHAVDSAAPLIARSLATELAAWGNGGQAVMGAASRCRDGAPPAAARVLQAAAARVLLGGEAAASLRGAMDDAVQRSENRAPAARVAAVFALHRHDAVATAAALERLAAALEAQAALHSDVRAAVAEVRMSAIAVPVIAAATLIMLLATDQAALVAALSPPLLPVLAVAAVLVTIASLGVRRLTAPW